MRNEAYVVICWWWGMTQASINVTVIIMLHICFICRLFYFRFYQFCWRKRVSYCMCNRTRVWQCVKLNEQITLLIYLWCSGAVHKIIKQQLLRIYWLNCRCPANCRAVHKFIWVAMRFSGILTHFLKMNLKLPVFSNWRNFKTQYAVSNRNVRHG